jgi:hypothetical protein
MGLLSCIIYMYVTREARGFESGEGNVMNKVEEIRERE